MFFRECGRQTTSVYVLTFSRENFVGYLANLLNALLGLGDSLDRAEDAALGGPAGESISIRCSKAMLAGKHWGVFACFLLTWLVQNNHCYRVYNNLPMKSWDVVRAAVWLTIWIWFPLAWLFNGFVCAISILVLALVLSITATALEKWI